MAKEIKMGGGRLNRTISFIRSNTKLFVFAAFLFVFMSIYNVQAASAISILDIDPMYIVYDMGNGQIRITYTFRDHHICGVHSYYEPPANPPAAPLYAPLPTNYSPMEAPYPDPISSYMRFLGGASPDPTVCNGYAQHAYADWTVEYVYNNITTYLTDLGNQCSISTPMGSSANLKSGNLYHSQDIGGLTFSYNSRGGPGNLDSRIRCKIYD